MILNSILWLFQQKWELEAQQRNYIESQLTNYELHYEDET